MTSTTHAALILGGSGRTGSLVASHHAGHGIPARTASRHGGDVFFDWDDPATYPDALAGTDRVYLVTPVLRVRYAARVAEFLDQAEAAGTRHVTLLSTYNGERARPRPSSPPTRTRATATLPPGRRPSPSVTSPRSSPPRAAGPSGIRTSTRRPGSARRSRPACPPATPSCSAGSRAPSSAATGRGPRAMARPVPAGRRPASQHSPGAMPLPGPLRRTSDQVHQRQLELRCRRPLLPHHQGRAGRPRRRRGLLRPPRRECRRRVRDLRTRLPQAR